MNMDECIRSCTDCSRVCLETIAYCLEQGGQHASAADIKLLQDCADICQVSAASMARKSEMHGRFCALCAEIGEKCVEACERLGGDAQMQRCAEACRKCAEQCREEERRCC